MGDDENLVEIALFLKRYLFRKVVKARLFQSFEVFLWQPGCRSFFSFHKTLHLPVTCCPPSQNSILCAILSLTLKGVVMACGDWVVYLVIRISELSSSEVILLFAFIIFYNFWTLVCGALPGVNSFFSLQVWTVVGQGLPVPVLFLELDNW